MKIKKLIVCVVCACLFLLAACGDAKAFPQDITCEQILNAASAAIKQPQNTVLYNANENPLDSYKMSLWADGMYSECAEYEALSDYAICYSSDNTTYEISVLKAKDKDGAEKLKAVFERRKETLSGGDKAAYDPDFEELMDDSRIITEGEIVILLITSDNDAAAKAIENLKQ